MSDPSSLEYTLVLLPSGRRGRVAHGANLLDEARALGVELESICGGRQTCGKCQVVVEEGHFAKHDLSSRADHLTPVGAREAETCSSQAIEGRRLACAAQVVGDLLITVPEESQAHKQVIAKAATDRRIDVRPAVRQVYAEVDLETLGGTGGDWEALQQALDEQWDLRALRIEPSALAELQRALRASGGGVTLTLWSDSIVLRVEPGYAEGVYGLAVDVGTTTLAGHLCDLRTGELLASRAAMNPQVRYGEDLMSRVSYGMGEAQGVERMHRAVVRAVNELAEAAAAEAGLRADQICDAVFVANPIMHHLLLGIDPVELGRAPFALAVSGPVDLRARDLGLALHPAARAHLLPCIAGHVGADHVAVLLAEAPHQQDETMLVIDVGTNAEIALGNRERLLCASSPTGPAFEGAQISHGQRAAAGAVEHVRIDPETLEPRLQVIGQEGWIEPGTPSRATGICGSGIIEAVAELFLAGILDADGRFNEQAAARSARVQFEGRTGRYELVGAGSTATGRPIVITQQDVRAIQLAKAALYTGVKLLMGALGVDRVDRIVLAGAFGSFISPTHAMLLGMIPDCDLERVAAVGNAAGDGARIALLDRTRRVEAAQLAGWVEHVQTASHPDFQDQFVAALAIPHATDSFPHLTPLLASRPTASVARRSQRREPVSDIAHS
jgi:uncharacterized 2Fe-2S/4Fe-4S cluster protein (DUF4445 family)